MPAEPTIKARIAQLYKTEAEWAKLSEFVPNAGEFIIYAPEAKIPYHRIKIGDGVHRLSELSFVVEAFFKNQKGYLDAGRVTDYATQK